MAQITWKDLYFDLYRQVYGENATTAGVMKDVAARRRIIRANRARLAEQEQEAIDSARAKAFTLDAFLVSVGQRPAPETRHCERCGEPLNDPNDPDFCEVCFQEYGRAERQYLMDFHYHDSQAERDRIQSAIYDAYTDAERENQARMEAYEFYGHSGRRTDY